MTGRAFVIGAAIWFAVATIVGLFTGRCLKLLNEESDNQ